MNVMDNCDWYCAICGGPFRGIRFATEETTGYDPDAFEPRETRWTESMYILGYNEDASGDSKSYIANGRYVGADEIRVYAEPGETRDPNFSRKHERVLSTAPHSRDDDELFPLHLPCLELLSFYVTRSRAFNLQNLSLDKDALYLAMLSVRQGGDMDWLPNWFASDCSIESWQSLPGYEFLVAHPGPLASDSTAPSNPVTTYLRAILPPAAVRQAETKTGISSRGKDDPFSGLPIELVFKISALLDDRSLSAWCVASWTLDSLLRDNNRFWRHRIMRVSMPWLDEVFPLLDNKNLMAGVDGRALFHMLKKLTLPRLDMGGVMMGVANRRRIWRACELIGQEYREMLEEMKRLGSALVRARLLPEPCYCGSCAAQREMEDSEAWDSEYWEDEDSEEEM